MITVNTEACWRRIPPRAFHIIGTCAIAEEMIVSHLFKENTEDNHRLVADTLAHHILGVSFEAHVRTATKHSEDKFTFTYT